MTNGPLSRHRIDSAAAEPQVTPVQPIEPQATPPDPERREERLQNRWTIVPAEPAQPTPSEPVQPIEPQATPAAQEPTLAFLMAEIGRLREAQAAQIKAIEAKAARDLAAADEAAGIRMWPDQHGFRCIGKVNARGEWEPVQALESAVILQEIQVPAKASDTVFPARVVVAVKGFAPETVARSLTTILKTFTDRDWEALRDTVRDCRSPEREQEYAELLAERGSNRGKASGASRRRY